MVVGDEGLGDVELNGESLVLVLRSGLHRVQMIKEGRGKTRMRTHQEPGVDDIQTGSNLVRKASVETEDTSRNCSTEFHQYPAHTSLGLQHSPLRPLGNELTTEEVEKPWGDDIEIPRELVGSLESF